MRKTFPRPDLFRRKRRKAGQRAPDALRRDAIGNPHIPGTAEILPGHKQQFIFSRPLAESVRVRLRGFHKQIKRPVRISAGKSEVRQSPIQEIAVAPIDAEIGRFAVAFRRHALKESGRAYEPEHPSRAAHGRIQRLCVRRPRIHGNVPDPLAGQGQRFGIGIADERIGIIPGNIRHFRLLVIDEFAIRLVGNQIDGMPVLLLLFLEETGKFPNGLFPVHHPRGIVGRIDDDPFHRSVHRLLKRFEVGQKGVLFGRNRRKFRPRSLHKDFVFGKIGRKDDKFVPRTGQRMNGDGQTGRRPAGHVQIVAGNVRAEARVEVGGNSVAAFFIPLRRRIAVQFHRRRFFQNTADRFVHAGGRRHRRIADGKIEHVFCADLRSSPLCILENLPYRRTPAAQAVHLFVDHFFLPPVFRRLPW